MFDIKDFLDMSNDDILKKNGGKKFDIVLMNPPYDRGLHMDFLKRVSEISNNVISVQPINKFQSAKLNSKNLPIKVTNIDIIKDANSQFELSFKYPIGIVFIDKNSTADYNKVNCILYEEIYNKIKNKNLPLFKKQIKKQPQGNYSIRCSVGTGFDPEHNYNWISPTFNIAKRQDIKGHTGFISVNSEKEQKNLFKYCHTHFFKFCIIIGQDKLAPFMNDYTNEWNDEKLFKYFDLSNNDINIINKEASKYDKELKY